MRAERGRKHARVRAERGPSTNKGENGGAEARSAEHRRVRGIPPADDAFQAGNRALQAGKIQEAEDRYEEAFRLRPSPDVAANLAQAEKALGKRAEAAEHIAYAIRTRAASTRPEQKAAMEALLAELQKGVCSLSVQANVSGATVSVDGRPVGTEPLKAPIFLEPGSHIIRAELDEHEPKEQMISVTPGTSLSIKLVLVPKEGRGGGGGGGKPLWPLGLLIGAAAAGVGLTAAGFAVRQAKISDAEELGAELPDNACTFGGTDCERITDLYGQSNSFLIMGVAGTALLGLAAIGTLTYLAVPGGDGPKRRPSPQASLSVVPMLGPVTGVSLQGRF